MTDVRRLFGGPEYVRLFTAVRRRFEESGETARTTRLETLTVAEGKALAGIFGLPRLPKGSFSVDFTRLDLALKSSAAGMGLRDVLRELGGPLKDRRALRASERAAVDALWTKASEVAGSHSLREWLSELRGRGLLRRAARAGGKEEGRLLNEALSVAMRLPAHGTPLAVLAVETTGDTHALDVGRPLSGLVLRAAAKMTGRPGVPAGSAERRKLWEEVGVVCDPLSPHALVLGLRPSGDDHLSQFLRQSAEAGEAVKLTLAQVSRIPITLPKGMVIRVCENPSVMSITAKRLGESCPALVCTEGVPSTAVMVLLESLRHGGANILFHGDFDWGGLRIANEIFTRFEARPWRFGKEDYLQAVAAGLGSAGLAAGTVEASWDSGLAPAMRATNQTVYEERVVEILLKDLA